MIEQRKRSLIDKYGYIVPEHYGLVPWHGAVATFRPGEGPNGLDAIAVEEATENACAHRIAMGIDGWGNRHSMVEVIESPTPSPFGTRGVLKVASNVGGTINHTARSYIQMKSDTELTNVFSASVFVKSAGFDRVRMRVSMNTAMSTGGANVNAVIDLVDGSVLSSGRMGSDVTPPNWRVERFSNGWFRIIADNVVFTGPGAGNPGDEHGNIDGPVIGLFVWDSEATEGDGESGFYVWGPQVETKPFATSFVDGVRGHGRLVYPPNVFNQESFTIAMTVGQSKPSTEGNLRYFQIGPNVVGERIVAWKARNTNNIYLAIPGASSGSNTAITLRPSNYDEDVFNRIVFVRDGDYAAVRFNDEVESDTRPRGTVNLTNLDIGSTDRTYEVLNALISDLLILPYAATPEQIASWGGPEKPLPIFDDATLQWGTGGVRVARSVMV